MYTVYAVLVKVKLSHILMQPKYCDHAQERHELVGSQVIVPEWKRKVYQEMTEPCTIRVSFVQSIQLVCLVDVISLCGRV